METLGDVRVLLAQYSLSDFQRSLEQRFGFSVLALRVIESAQIVKTSRHTGTIINPFACCDSLLEENFSIGLLAFRIVDYREVIKSADNAGAQFRSHRFISNLAAILDDRLYFGILTLRLVKKSRLFIQGLDLLSQVTHEKRLGLFVATC